MYTSDRRIPHTIIAKCAAAALVALLFALPAAASDTDDDCPEFFPDFSCDREARYEGFIPTTSMPYLFEDPFITTGLSLHGLWHDFPWDSVFRGGDAYVVALQARVAITDRLAFIATKDGYTWLRPGSHSQIAAEEGFFDIAAGFKYALIDMPEEKFILTPSLRVDLPVGESRVFSGNGDGVLIPAVSSAKGIGPLNFIAGFGSRLPLDNNKESTSLFYNLHVDANFCECFVPFLELNGTTWVNSGNGERNVRTKAFGSVDLQTAQDVLAGAGVLSPTRFEGADVVNLGSTGVAGHTVMTLAVGGRVPITKDLSLGAYYEFPVTSREDIFEQRVAVNFHWEL